MTPFSSSIAGNVTPENNEVKLCPQEAFAMLDKGEQDDCTVGEVGVQSGNRIEDTGVLRGGSVHMELNPFEHSRLSQTCI